MKPPTNPSPLPSGDGAAPYYTPPWMVRGPIASNGRRYIHCLSCGRNNRVWSPTPVGLVICPDCQSKRVSYL